jgi:predicted PurR-regulated permease PerM
VPASVKKQFIATLEEKQMSTFKRILAWILIVISVLGILVCFLGAAGSWLINDSLTQGILGVLTRAETALSRVEDSLTLADAQLKDASSAIATVQEAASKLGDRIEENTPILDRIAQILKDELGPAVTRIRDAFLKIEERIQTVNNAIETLNVLPGIQLSTLDIQMEGPNERVGLVVDAVQQLQQNVADFRAGIVQSMAPFKEKLDRIAGFLNRLEEDVTTFIKQVNNLQTGLANAKVNIPSIIDRVTLAISLIFLWFILAQIALFLVARAYLKTGRMVWESPSSETPSAKEALPAADL